MQIYEINQGELQLIKEVSSICLRKSVASPSDTVTNKMFLLSIWQNLTDFKVD